MPVEIWDARQFTTDQARSIGELIHRVWPKPTMTVADRAAQQLAIGANYVGRPEQAPRAMVVVDAGRVVANATMEPRTIRAADRDIVVGALSRVCTDPALRGRGLGEAVVRAAFGLVDAGDFPFALFQTKRHLAGFYEQLGCVEVFNRFVNSLGDDPQANPFWDEIVMRYPADGDWPAGTIDLRGPAY